MLGKRVTLSTGFGIRILTSPLAKYDGANMEYVSFTRSSSLWGDIGSSLIAGLRGRMLRNEIDQMLATINFDM